MTAQGRERPAPPASVAAEQALLGAILTGRASWPEVAVGDFYLADHRTIARTVRAMSDRAEIIDLVTVAEGMERAGTLDDAGGMPYLGTLAAAAGAADNCPAYASIIREKALERSLMALGARLADGQNGAIQDARLPPGATWTHSPSRPTAPARHDRPSPPT